MYLQGCNSAGFVPCKCPPRSTFIKYLFLAKNKLYKYLIFGSAGTSDCISFQT